MTQSIEDIRQNAEEILRTDYQTAKKAILRLEVFRRTKSKKAIYELRDFLDHYASIFKSDIAPDMAEKHLHECRTHLRRAAVEPLEYMAEKCFVKLDAYARFLGRIPIPSRPNPFADRAFFEQMHKMKVLIADGRMVKTEGEACKLMDEAYSIGAELLAKVTPYRFLVSGVLWLIGLFVAALIGGGVTHAFFAE